MRTVKNIVDEIKSLHTTVGARKKLGTPTSQNLVEKLVSAITKAIENLQELDVDSANLLYSALDACDVDAASKMMLSSAIDGRLEAILDAEEDLIEGQGLETSTHHGVDDRVRFPAAFLGTEEKW